MRHIYLLCACCTHGSIGPCWLLWLPALTLPACLPCCQLDIEWYFRDTAALAGTDTYWMGLYRSLLYWYWADGNSVGNGVVSNAGPYAHWWVAGSGTSS
jgi:hypothetical protein